MGDRPLSTSARSARTRSARRLPGRRACAALLALSGLALSGCATLQQIAALRSVDFSIAGTSGSMLAGVPIGSIRDFDDLRATDVVRLGAALSSGSLPLQSDILIGALNPADNVEARLLGLEWTLYLDDRETVSGYWDEERTLPPGQAVIVPVRVSLDLLDFFEGSLQQIAELALAAAGAGEPRRIHLEAVPSIQTSLGPIRYPRPIRIEYRVDPLVRSSSTIQGERLRCRDLALQETQAARPTHPPELT